MADREGFDRSYDPDRSVRRHLAIAAVGISLLFAGVGGWAATASVSGAVIASGALVVDTNLRRIQHGTGGIIADIRVRNGARVDEGDLLLRLDDTVTRANLQLLNSQLRESAARLARLTAEISRANDLAPSALLAEVATPEDANAVLAAERALLLARREALDGQRSQLSERIAQTRLEIDGLQAQIDSNDEQIGFVDRELAGMRDLHKRNLVPLTRLLTYERERSRLVGTRGALAADQARARTRISETQLQIIQLDQEFRRETISEQRQLEQRMAELLDRRVAALFQLDRVEVRAPSAGVVHELAVHTIGGVINPGEPLMLIVPDADSLLAEVQINPIDIDQMQVGRPTRLRFTSLNLTITPEIGGTVRFVSADVARDPQTGASFYRARIAIDKGEIAKLGPVQLVPGMPVESFITIGERTVVSYLTRPLWDQIARSFRAE